MKSLHQYITESKEITRSDMINKLKSFMKGKKTIEVPADFYINDSDDGKGEDHEVYKMGTQTQGYGKGQFGVWVGPDDDFYPIGDLSDNDIDDLIGFLIDNL